MVLTLTAERGGPGQAHLNCTEEVRPRERRSKGRRRPAVEREDGRHGPNVNRPVLIPVILAVIVARADAGDSSNNLSG